MILNRNLVKFCWYNNKHNLVQMACATPGHILLTIEKLNSTQRLPKEVRFFGWMQKSSICKEFILLRITKMVQAFRGVSRSLVVYFFKCWRLAGALPS